MTILQKVERKLSLEMKKQQDLQYTSAAMVLKNNFGWETPKIRELFVVSGKIWDECGADSNKSVLSMLDDETGVVMTLEDGKCYDEYDFLAESHPNAVWRITPGYLVAIRNAQIKWCGACVLGALFLALHRFDGWDYVRLMDFQEKIDAMQRDYNYDTKKMLSDAEDKAGIKMLWGGK